MSLHSLCKVAFFGLLQGDYTYGDGILLWLGGVAVLALLLAVLGSLIDPLESHNPRYKPNWRGKR